MDIRYQPYYKYLSPKIKRTLELAYGGNKQVDNERQKQLDRAEFIRTYKPEKSMASKIGSDMKTFVGSLPRIPGSLEHTFKKSVADTTGIYDMDKPFWKQAFKPVGSLEEYKKNLGMGARNVFGVVNLMLNAPYTENIEPLNRFKENNPFFKKSASADLANKFILDSMIKGTGKFIYDPESKGRRWIPKPSEGTRYQNYKDNPFLTGLEDVVNLSIVGAPILKALGVGEKVAKLAPVKTATKWAKETAVGENVVKFQGRMATRQAFNEMLAGYRGKAFTAKEGILYNNKFVRAFKDVPENTAKHLFKVAEGTADWTDDVARLSFKDAVKSGYEGTYKTFKSSADNALKVVRKNAVRESNWLVKKGILTEEEALKSTWTPAVKKYLTERGIKNPNKTSVAEANKLYFEELQKISKQTISETDKALSTFSYNTQTGSTNILKRAMDWQKKMETSNRKTVVLSSMETSEMLNWKVPQKVTNFYSYDVTKAPQILSKYNVTKNIEQLINDINFGKTIATNEYKALKELMGLKDLKTHLPKYTPAEAIKLASERSIKKAGTGLDDIIKYTEKELDDLLVKNKGFAKSLEDDFAIATKELKDMGIESPVYMPHMWEEKLLKSDFYSKQPLYKYKPGFLKKRTGMSGYMDEPVTVLTRHQLQKVKWRLSNDLVDTIIKKYGKKISEDGILTGYKKYYPEGFLKNLFSKGKYGKEIQLPDFMVSELNRIFNAPSSFEKFLRATYDPITKTWKTSVLALSPRWVFNNFMGNTLLNIAGAVDPFAYYKAYKVMTKARRLAEEKGWTVNKAMKKLGIPEEVSRGLYQAETRGSIAGFSKVADTAPIQNMFGKALNYTGLPQIAKGMYRFNSGIESFYRTAHYLDKIGKPGFNVARAVKSVNEFLFDYNAMSSFEKTVIRRIIPFWAWQKNITRLMATYPFKYPQRMAVLQKLQKQIEDPKGMNFDFLPEYMRAYVPTPFKTTTGESMYLSTRGINPYSDVGVSLSNINPVLKLALERTLGTNLFKNRPFTSPYRGYSSNEKIIPSLGRHIGSQFPQYQLYQNLRYPYAKYDTGEPILDKNGQPKYSKSRLLDSLKMLGISITPYDLDSMTQKEISDLIRKQTAKRKYKEKLEKFQRQ